MSEDEAPNLFAGKKIWIAQRVPTRPRWIELVEKHGGRHVKLDKQADILIADHARKDAPAGSISWRFIEATVKKGELQDPSDYPAGAVVPSGQDSAISLRPSGMMARTAYTAEDDRQLWDWVKDAEKRCVHISGNKIYQDLAAINPRHTWHSWRDRWLKTLAHRDKPASSNTNDDTSPQPSPRVEPPTLPQNVGRRRAPPSSNPHLAHPAAPAADISINRAESQSSGPIQSQTATSLLGEESPGRRPSIEYDEATQEPGAGIPFTDKDEELLRGMSQEIENIDPDKIIEAWDAMARQYPKHTADEWRNFWLEIRPSDENDEAIAGKIPRSATPVKKKIDQARETSTPGEPQETLQRPGTPPIQSQEQATPEGMSLRPQETLQRPETPPIQTEGQALPEDMRQRQTTSETLVHFLKEQDPPVHRSVGEEICGNRVLLYDICSAVTSAFDKDASIQRIRRWEEVAWLLGIKQSPLNINTLKSKFGNVVHYFFDFEEFLLSMQEETRSDAGTGNDGDDEANHVDTLNSPILSLEANMPGKRKRAESNGETPGISANDHTATEDSINKTPDSSKRQRLDKGKGKSKELEIPSTPEALYQPRRNKYLAFQQDPETQDFHFPQATQDEENLSTYSREDSPSNQIQDEAYRATQQSPPQDLDSSQEDRTAARRKVDHFVSLGYTEDIVHRAFAATTMNEENAAYVMEELTKGNDIPDELRGVWTEEDDLALFDEDDGMERMLVKHGQDGVEDRMAWLEALEEVEKLQRMEEPE